MLPGAILGKGNAMHDKQRVADMAVEVLTRQAKLRAAGTGRTIEGALNDVLKTEAGQQLGDLRDGPHRDERSDKWQEDLAPKRVEERKRAERQERDRAQREADWNLFMRTEMQELELRKDGQLGRLLGEPQPGESAAALRRLCSEDQRQAERGMVAVMKNGGVSYKHVGELDEGDMPARVAANRLRTTWLKERRDGWIAGKGRRS